MTAQHVPEPSWTDAWMAVRDRLRMELGQGVFDSWIAPLSLIAAADGVVRLSSPSRLVRDYTASHYGELIDKAFGVISADFCAVEIVVTAGDGRSLTARTLTGFGVPRPVAGVPGAYPGAKATGAALTGMWDRVPDPAQSFSSFLVGPCNEFAFKVAQRLAQGGESSPGLLFIHGGFGHGKTHLLNAIALEVRQQHRARALFLGAEDFMRRFVSAVRSQETLTFKEELRAADILLIDDLQHICGKATVSELLHTVNAFTELKRKVVIAADRPPSGLDGLTEDIRSRLKGALAIVIARPDGPTRLAILRAKACELERKLPRAKLPDSVLQLLAEEVDATPRELVGLLLKLATYADLTGKPVTAEIAEEWIGSRGSAADRRTTIEEIQRKTAEYYKLDLRELHSPRRVRRVARPRQVAMFLARELTSRSLPDIGRRFGGRDHTTVLHACRRIEELCRTDPVVQQEVEFLRKVLGPRAHA